MGHDLRTPLPSDMSGSMVSSGNLEPLQNATKQFVTSLYDNQDVGIFALDGRQQIQEIVGFTQNKAAQSCTILPISTVKDSSTNLNAAYFSITTPRCLCDRNERKDSLKGH